MKLGKQTASVANWLMSGTQGQPIPEVGMGVTELHWTDRHAGTIVRISPSGKTFFPDPADALRGGAMRTKVLAVHLAPGEHGTDGRVTVPLFVLESHTSRLREAQLSLSPEHATVLAQKLLASAEAAKQAREAFIAAVGKKQEDGE